MFSLSRDILIGFLLVCAAAWGLMETRTLRFADGPDEVHRNAIAKQELGRYLTK